MGKSDNDSNLATMKIKLAIAEDNSFLLNSILEKLSFYDDLQVKFHGENGNLILEQLEDDHNVDIILMDIQMPELDGIKTTRLVKQRYPQIKVVMLTVFDDDQNIIDAIQAGADGYLLKDTGPEALHKGIHEILEGGAPITPSIALKVLGLMRKVGQLGQPAMDDTDSADLSKREVEILEQISRGLNYQQIAENLFIAPSTVRKHIENIYKKMQVHNKMEAVQKASKQGII